jgi:hypothetical protein
VKDVPDGPVEAFIDDSSAAKCSREDSTRTDCAGWVNCGARVPGQIGGDGWAAALALRSLTSLQGT